MKTSRAVVHRLLDESDASVTLARDQQGRHGTRPQRDVGVGGLEIALPSASREGDERSE